MSAYEDRRAEAMTLLTSVMHDAFTLEAQRDRLIEALRLARSMCNRPFLGRSAGKEEYESVEREYRRDLARIDAALAEIEEAS